MMSRTIPTFEQLPPDVRQGLTHLSADAVGTFGPTPLSTLVTAHLSVLAELRRLGADWTQIAGLLAGLGILGNRGPIAADVLRATYARARTAAVPPGAKRNGTQPVETKQSLAETNEGASLPSATDQNRPQQNATERDAEYGRATQRSQDEPNESNESLDDAASFLRKRAAFLNRSTQPR